MISKKMAGLALFGILSTGQAYATATLTEWGAIATISKSICGTEYCGDDSDILNFIANLSVDPVNGGWG